MMVTALQHSAWMDEEGFKLKKGVCAETHENTCTGVFCFEFRQRVYFRRWVCGRLFGTGRKHFPSNRFKNKRGGIHQRLYGTWVAVFMLRQDAGRFMLGKYLSDKKIAWQQRRQLGMAVAGNTPTASFLNKIGKMQSAEFRLYRIAREARGESTDGLAAEKRGHINSAGCEGMSTTVTAAHHSMWRHLYDSMHAAQKPKSKLKFVTLDKESNMSTQWRREEFLRICSKEELTEKAQDIEAAIPVKTSQEARYNLDPESFFVNRIWGRRLDGVAINKALQIVCILNLNGRQTGSRGS